MPTSDPAHAHVSPAAKRFRLQRFFAVTSLAGIALVTGALLGAFGLIDEQRLIAQEGRSNAALGQLLANQMGPPYRDLVREARGKSRDALLADPRLDAMQDELRGRLVGLPVVKVKLYDPTGLTVFSTDATQIGLPGNDGIGLRRALRGDVSSRIIAGDRFDPQEGTLEQRALIATHVPIRIGSADTPEAVLELFSDVTALTRQQDITQWRVAALVLGLLGMLYLFLAGLVRKADHIIARQAREAAEREARVRHEARHDALTGLPNRAAFHRQLSKTVGSALRTGGAMALLFIDLDRFKAVNDRLGHEAGDRLLRQVAERLGSTLESAGAAFRTGGDEFTIVLPAVTGESDAIGIARRIRTAVAHPYRLDEHDVQIDTSIGIALCPTHATDAETLVAQADAAMYYAKRDGRGTHAVYRPSMGAQSVAMLEMETALRQALERGEFVLLYQPRVDAGTGQVVAVEALLRWLSPTLGMQLPDAFLPVLEETGLIGRIGDWVLTQACVQHARWMRNGMPSIRLSVNVSPAQLRREQFLESVDRAVNHSGIDPALLEIELSEAALAADGSAAQARMAALRRLGPRVAIDDFGTGHSSLRHLRTFDTDVLKLDCSIVHELAVNTRERDVMRALVDIAKTLRMRVVAEGVETEAQAQVCTALGCHELQGYLFSRPLPAHRIPDFVSASRRPKLEASPPQVSLRT